MLAANGYRTKKELHAAVGTRLKYYETSFFGPEYPSGGTGQIHLVGPGAYNRKWYALVTLKDHIITEVR